MLLQPDNLVGIALQPGTLFVGHVPHVECPVLAETKDGEGAVVVADDDKAALLTQTEHIEPTDQALVRESCVIVLSVEKSAHEPHGQHPCLSL